MRIDRAGLPQAKREQYLAVVRCLFRSTDPAGISTDELMLDAGIEPQQCFRILHALESLGVIARLRFERFEPRFTKTGIERKWPVAVFSFPHQPLDPISPGVRK